MARLTFDELHCKCIPILYTTREGGDWHGATVSPAQYLASFRTGRLGALRIAALRVVDSCLIYDHVLARFPGLVPSPWRIHQCLTNASAAESGLMPISTQLPRGWPSSWAHPPIPNRLPPVFGPPGP